MSNCVVIAPSVTKEIAQNCPVGGVAGETVDPVRITHPASPNDCLSMLFVIGVVYRIKGWGVKGYWLGYVMNPAFTE